MRLGWQGTLRGGLLGLLLTACCCPDVASSQKTDNANPDAPKGDKKFGDKCSSTEECGFEGSICDLPAGKCSCKPELVTNHLDKCGTAARVNESCFFNEQCEYVTSMTECKDGMCSCKFEKQPVFKSDGSVECIVVQNVVTTPGTYVDPAMIGILVAMFLMFITICVVLRLFSRARWRENRTIFNTPNPRLMNVSLLRENKHPERRGSRCSVREPSRPPSMTSLRAHSPNSQGSRASSNASAASMRSNKSPPTANAGAVMENVTIEVEEPKSKQ